MVDPAGEKARAETVVDIDDAYAAGAAVEHTEKRRKAVKARAVSDRGRNADDRTIDQPADNACKRALHSGNGNYNVGLHQNVQFG